MVLWRPTRPFRTNTLKRCPSHYKGLECKSRKSRNTWSKMHIWPWNTEWSKSKTNRVLPRKCTGHNKHPLPTTEEKTIHGHHQMVNTEIKAKDTPKHIPGLGATFQRGKTQIHSPEYRHKSLNHETFTRHWTNYTHGGRLHS